MKVKVLYKYEREPGKVTVGFVKPVDKPHTEVYRIIAEEGKALTTDGVTLFNCLDVEDVTPYYEVETQEESNEEY